MKKKLKKMYKLITCITGFATLFSSAVIAQSNSSSNYTTVNTYVNPVLPGDHPDPTMLRVGKDFYHCGSSFHFTPYMPIYHSTDMVHWEIISRVLTPAKASWVTDRPSAGTWQGALTYFYGSYWIYFSANGQWFSKASTPYGPWSDAVQVKSNPQTGPLGYDNSIFVDDDGKPYMVIKNGQKINRLQALGKDGQLTDTVINLDWINAKLQYSWAEGPVMCKRNGFYYYFPAGDVSGGQYVLRGKSLTSDSTQWERLGDFFKPVTDPAVGFRRPNHISAPLQLDDGSWWTIGQSYEKYDHDDWSGRGRQTSLFPVIWEGDRPWGMAPTTAPIIKPNLPQSGIPWRSVSSDAFEKNELDLCWHFLSKKDAAHYSLSARKGFIRLTPDSGRTSIVQKETDRYYAAVTKLEFDPSDTSHKAGLYLTNGNQKVFALLYAGYSDRSQIILKFDTAVRSIPNTFKKTVWLKIIRYNHELSGYCSADGKNWISIGAPVNLTNLDKAQPNFNSWVGTSVGLFAEGKSADFDLFTCKDGFSAMPAIGYSNYYGIEKITAGTGEESVTSNSDLGGWLMISGVDLGINKASKVEVLAGANKSGNLEIWLDDLKNGKLIATIPITANGKAGLVKKFSKALKNVSGSHDVFIKFPAGNNHNIFLNNIRFAGKE